MTKFVTLSIDRLNQVIEALNSYCNTGEIDCADDLVAELLAERDQKQGDQEPVAWCALNADRSGIAYFDGKPIIMTGPIGNEHHPDPLYTKPQPNPGVREAWIHGWEAAKLTNNIK